MNDLRKALLAREAYDNPTHVVENAAMLMRVEDGCLNVAIAGTNDGSDIVTDMLMIPY